MGGACGDDEEDFCARLCPAHITCSAELHGTTAPLFCDSDIESACLSACSDAMVDLRHYEDAFLECAECVLDKDSEDVCDREKAAETREGACSEACSEEGTGNVSARFHDDLTKDFTEATEGDLSCSGQGEIGFSVEDPDFSHEMGFADPIGGWACDATTGCSGYLFSGPYVTLPPGSYKAEFQASATGGIGAEIVFRVHGSGAELARFDSNAASLPPVVEMDFTLDAMTEYISLSMWGDGQAESMRAVAVYVVRK